MSSIICRSHCRDKSYERLWKWLMRSRDMFLIRVFPEIVRSLFSCTVACNYLSVRVTKTCPASQSKFKVLTIKLQSSAAHLGTFWRHFANTWRETKSPTRTGIMSFAVLTVVIVFFLSTGKHVYYF